MAKLTYETARSKMLNGMSPVDVYGDWQKANPEPTLEEIEHTKAAIAFAWDETRKTSIKARIGRRA